MRLASIGVLIVGPLLWGNTTTRATAFNMMRCLSSSAPRHSSYCSSSASSLQKTLSSSPSSFSIFGAASSRFLQASRIQIIVKRKRISSCDSGGRRSYYSGRSSLVMMPEGPEVRTLVNQLQTGVGLRLVDWKFLSGRYLRHGKPAGWDAFRKTMTPLSTAQEQQEIESEQYAEAGNSASVDCILEWNCKGKFIYILLDDGAEVATTNSNLDFSRSIWITLGMTGRFVSESVHSSTPRDQQQHARWYLEVADTKTTTNPDEQEQQQLRRFRIYYYDARNFGTLKFCTSRQELLEKIQSLGPDILETETTTDYVFEQLVAASKQSLNICRFLMNQSKIAGIGNYVLAEGLYRASIDPFCTLGELSVEQQRCLFRELQKVAMESYESQGMTRPDGGQYRTMDGSQGRYTFELQCYGRTQAANGEIVYQDVNGPHGRTIWYTKEQLFMPLHQRNDSINLSTSSSSSDNSSNDQDRDDDSDCTMSETINRSTQSAVIDMTSHLTEPSWIQALSLSTLASSDWFDKLAHFVAKERYTNEIYPPPELVFASLNLCPMDQVKVVIVGQDPYHGPGQGHGLAFSVQKGVRPPPSLLNIFKEVQSDVGIPTPTHGNLEHWARQGVLLLNSVLTVRRGQANSHARQGWEKLTDEIIGILNERRTGLVFLLWGTPARRKAAAVDESKHTVIRTSHPSPLGATKTQSPFLGSRCFSRANAALESHGQTAIDWSVR